MRSRDRAQAWSATEPRIAAERTQSARRNRFQRGATLTEAIIVMPVLVLLALAITQVGLIAHARSNLHYAALMGARAGATQNAATEAIIAGVSRGLMPMFHAATLSPAVAAERAQLDFLCFGRVELLSPTATAIADFQSEVNPGVLPNSWLARRSAEPGAVSGLTIQDANRLKIKVTYAVKLIVPFINRILPATLLMMDSNPYDEVERAWLADGRFPLTVTSIVRMQSQARLDVMDGTGLLTAC